MITEIEKRFIERQFIKKETHKTIIISLILIAESIALGLIAYFVKVEPWISDTKKLESLYGIVNLVVIMVMIVILGIRRSIYYSERLIPETATLTQILQKWRTIDIVLLAIAETIPITGLIITFMGIPFSRTFHFFLASVLLMVILMPIGLKVKDKLAILRKTYPDIPLE